MILTVVYIVVGVFLYIKQRDFIYFPAGSIVTDYKQKIFNINNQTIKATIINHKKSNAIIYFGGNAEIVDYNADKFSKIFEEYSVYMVKYRGYSGSSGKITEDALYKDALAIYDEIKSEHKTISIIGRSLGSGVATWVASKRNINKLVLVTPFDSVESVAQKRFVLYPISIILNDKHNSIGRVNAIKASTLMLIAQNDEIIKYQHSKALADSFPLSQIKIKIIKDATHNNIIDFDIYNISLKNFFE